jgi:RNA polymerase sigma-70 factor, ECF subfamily
MANLENELITVLAERARKGDRQAFSQIVEQLMNSVVALTHKMTGNRDTALDLAQETFVAAWESIGGFRREARFETWLYRIAVNKTLTYLHNAKCESSDEMPETEAGSRFRPDALLDQSERETAIHDFMTGLPEQQRLAFELRFYRHMSFDEIAEATGKALGTVKTNYREALAKLRTYAIRKGLRP